MIGRVLGDVIVFNVLVNMALCAAAVALNCFALFRLRAAAPVASLLYVLVGVFWFVRYVLFFTNFDSLGLAYTNPVLLMLFTLTITALVAASIVRIYQFGGNVIMRQDIKAIIARLSRWTFNKH